MALDLLRGWKKKQVADWRSSPFLLLQNWSNTRKWYLTALGGLLVLNSTFSSSAPSGVLPEIAKVFDMSSEVSILVISVSHHFVTS